MKCGMWLNDYNSKKTCPCKDVRGKLLTPEKRIFEPALVNNQKL
jgi:hypothetical protein